jgi:hypothetical protein
MCVLGGVGVEMIEAGGALIGSSSKKKKEQLDRDELLQLKEAQRFMRPVIVALASRIAIEVMLLPPCILNDFEWPHHNLSVA